MAQKVIPQGLRRHVRRQTSTVTRKSQPRLGKEGLETLEALIDKQLRNELTANPIDSVVDGYPVCNLWSSGSAWFGYRCVYLTHPKLWGSTENRREVLRDCLAFDGHRGARG